MASSETPPPSIRQGVRIVPPDNQVSVEEVLLAAGEQVGHEGIVFASRMNKAVVVFLKDEPLVSQLIESGVFIRDLFVQVSPLSVPSTRITVSGVPPFIPNELLEHELRRFGKFASGFKSVSLGCKDPKVRHVQSLRRQVFMFLDSPTQTLEVSFRVRHGDGSYMVYANAGQLKCFECGDVGHKRFACPHKKQEGAHADNVAGGSAHTGAAAGAESASAAGPAAAAGDAPAAGGPVADHGAAGAAVGDTGSQNNDELCREEQIQPEKQQASVAAESLSSSQAADTEAASTGCAGRDHTVVPSEDQAALSSQVSCEGEEMEYDSESDTVSIGEKNTDLYSLEEINHFLDVTFKKSVKVSEYFSDTEKFVRSVAVLKRLVGFDLLDEKKRFRLKKHITAVRKEPSKTVRKSRRL